MIFGTRSAVLQRRLKIADWIRQHGQMRVDELSEALAVSAVTIRGDLNYLEEQGLLVRSFGKAVAARPLRPRERLPARSLAKPLVLPMLRLAAALIEPDQTLLVGPGEMPAQILPLLAEVRDLAVVLTTLDAVPLARRLLDGRVLLLAGELGLDGASLQGSATLRSLDLFPFSYFLMQAETLDSDGGLLLPSREAQRFAAAAAHRARRSIGLLERATQSLEKRPGELPLAALTDVILPSPPNARAGAVLAQAGFAALVQEAGAAAHYSRLKPGGEAQEGASQ